EGIRVVRDADCPPTSRVAGDDRLLEAALVPDGERAEDPLPVPDEDRVPPRETREQGRTAGQVVDAVDRAELVPPVPLPDRRRDLRQLGFVANRGRLVASHTVPATER